MGKTLDVGKYIAVSDAEKLCVENIKNAHHSAESIFLFASDRNGVNSVHANCANAASYVSPRN
jgi:hypothetical protein